MALAHCTMEDGSLRVTSPLKFRVSVGSLWDLGRWAREAMGQDVFKGLEAYIRAHQPNVIETEELLCARFSWAWEDRKLCDWEGRNQEHAARLKALKFWLHCRVLAFAS